MMSYISRAGTLIWHWIYWCAAMLFRAIVFPLVLFGLALYLLPDLFPRRGSKRSTAQPQNLRKRPHLRRDTDGVYWEMPDDQIIRMDGFETSLVLREVAEVVGGAYCYEKTKIRVDESA